MFTASSRTELGDTQENTQRQMQNIPCAEAHKSVVLSASNEEIIIWFLLPFRLSNLRQVLLAVTF